MRLAILFLLAVAPAAARNWPEVFTPPEVIQKTEPAYTQQALDEKVEGAVVLFLKVNENGSASDIKVIRALGKGLDEAAIACVQRWWFKPRMKWGKPVACYITVQIVFRLPQQKADV